MNLSKPFRDDAESTTIAGLTVENGADRIALYGNLEITRDQAGLAVARELSRFLIAVVAVLQSEPDLPAQVATPVATTAVRNPFT